MVDLTPDYVSRVKAELMHVLNNAFEELERAEKDTEAKKENIKVIKDFFDSILRTIQDL